MTPQTPTLGDRIREIVAAAQADDCDPVQWVQDWFADKDSRITRSEAIRLIILHVINYEVRHEV